MTLANLPYSGPLGVAIDTTFVCLGPHPWLNHFGETGRSLGK